MKVRYLPNYSGYVPIPRSVLLLVKEDMITISELSAYIFFIMQADFDKRHTYYTTILRTDKELAKEFHVSSTTIYRHRKKLIKTGLLLEKEGLTKITNYHMFELEHIQKLAHYTFSNMQRLFTKLMVDCASIENFIANMQDTQIQKVAQSSDVSSMGGGLSEDDKEWINQNLDEK